MDKFFIIMLVALVASVKASDYEDGFGTVPTRGVDKFSASKQGSADDRYRLITNKFNGYYSNVVNPDNVQLSFGVALIDFNVIEQSDVLNIYCWLRHEWEDDRLAWNPKDYGGAEVIRVNSKLVWKPDVTLYNTADPVNTDNCRESNVLISNSGKVLWVPQCRISAQCQFDLRANPDGEQFCLLKFGSWTFDASALDIQFFQKNAQLDLSYLINSSDFQVVSTSAQKNDVYYPCCVEPYPNLTFNLTVKRNP